MRHKGKKLFKAAAVPVFLIYIGGLIYLLFFSERYGRNDVADYYRYNLKPFQEIIRFWKYREVIGVDMVVENLAGNIVVFMPFGFLLPVIYEPLKKWYAILPVGVCFSAAIECVQLVTRVGSMDIDDVILNVTGVMLGFIFLKLCCFCRRRHGLKQQS